MVYIYLKYFADFILSLIALIILMPLFLIISILIKLTSRGPILFRQKRVGKDCKLFYIHKFRTMRIDTPKDCPTHLLEDPQKHITKIGKFLRKTSLDELPQIWDIFRGKMTIIGPRPALYNQDDLIAEREKYGANSLRPGLTGLAQVSGRDELDIPVKAKIDGEYIEKLNLWLDIKILFKTVFSVLKNKGVKEGKNTISANETAGETLHNTDFENTFESVMAGNDLANADNNQAITYDADTAESQDFSSTETNDIHGYIDTEPLDSTLEQPQDIDSIETQSMMPAPSGASASVSEGGDAA